MTSQTTYLLPFLDLVLPRIRMLNCQTPNIQEIAYRRDNVVLTQYQHIIPITCQSCVGTYYEATVHSNAQT